MWKMIRLCPLREEEKEDGIFTSGILFFSWKRGDRLFCKIMFHEYILIHY